MYFQILKDINLPGGGSVVTLGRAFGLPLVVVGGIVVGKVVVGRVVVGDIVVVCGVMCRVFDLQISQTNNMLRKAPMTISFLLLVAGDTPLLISSTSIPNSLSKTV